jgi:hypothetical protein
MCDTFPFLTNDNISLFIHVLYFSSSSKPSMQGIFVLDYQNILLVIF